MKVNRLISVKTKKSALTDKLFAILNDNFNAFVFFNDENNSKVSMF